MLLLIRNEMRGRAGGEAFIKDVLGFNRRFDEDDVLWIVLVTLAVSWRIVPALCFKFTTRPK
jgi:hypothetical protein